MSLELTAKELDWKIRALRPAPGAYFADFKGKRTKLWEIEPLAQTTEFEAGTVVEVSKHELILAAAENTTYSVKILQPAGKDHRLFKWCRSRIKSRAKGNFRWQRR